MAMSYPFPRKSVMVRKGITPSRNRRTLSPSTSTPVGPGDGGDFALLFQDAGDGPSHRIQSTSPVNSLTISAAVLHTPGFPNRLGNVPVIAPPAAFASVRATR